MTTRADVDRLGAATMRPVDAARRELERFWARFNGRGPEAFRDALLDFVPALVAQYGDAAATVAAEWYEQVRAAEVGGGYNALAAPGVDEAAVRGEVRYAAGHLFGDTPELGLAVLSGALQRYVLYSGRETVARNVERDRSRPRFARVPTGRKTCAFCSLMASRGFVYHSATTAGDRWGLGLGDDYHADCDCQIVPEWDAREHHITGYDPDDLYGKYLAARDASGSGDPKPILAEMRRMFPDDFTDGVVSL